MNKEEQQLQRAIIKIAQLMSGKYPQLKLLYAIPNGGYRNKIEARNLKLQGTLAGIPDLCLPVPNLQYHALYIELKSKKGTVKPHQKKMIELLQKYGNRVEIVRELPYFIRLIESYFNNDK